MTATPIPTHIHHSGRACVAKSTPLPASAEPAIEPHSATPILTPTWRLVEVTAAAAPARSTGMPLTAALVTGAFIIANPMPYTANMTTTRHIGVVAVSVVSISAADAIKMPAAISDGRAP
mgnify:CR=1 FL=1